MGIDWIHTLDSYVLLCCRCSAQTEICQSLFLELHAAGNIAEQTMEQLYSEAAGKFLADRFVVGTCPKCKYEVRVE
jgi:methionyl-tRNA synthetase